MHVAQDSRVATPEAEHGSPTVVFSKRDSQLLLTLGDAVVAGYCQRRSKNTVGIVALLDWGQCMRASKNGGFASLYTAPLRSAP